MADLKNEKSDQTENAKPKVDLGLLEEDDEFEEFPADGNLFHHYTCCYRISCCILNEKCSEIYLGLYVKEEMFDTFVDWTGKEEDADDVNVWEDNWDDDNVEDDFSQQLR